MYCEDCVEVLYVYDVREMWLDWHEEWDQRRKDNFLLRQDIVKPLSADDNVWLSIEHLVTEFHFRGSQLNIPLMKTLLADELQVQKPYWLIAITQIVETLTLEELGYQWLKEQLNPEWKLLGYDICAGPSFLMNSVWAEYEDELRNHLRPLLNQYHLFSDLETAKANWQSIHDREIYHGEFTINGLYLIEEINPEKK
ncbi:MAG: hypothetical protein RLP44_26155 [Aggregatilineales bacterium]